MKRTVPTTIACIHVDDERWQSTTACVRAARRDRVAPDPTRSMHPTTDSFK